MADDAGHHQRAQAVAVIPQRQQKIETHAEHRLTKTRGVIVNYSRPKVRLAEREVLRGKSVVHLSRSEFLIFLLAYMRGRLPYIEVNDALYGHKEDGGPEYDSASVLVHRANKKLKSLGLRLFISRQMLELET